MIDAITLRQSVRYASVGIGSNLFLYVCYLALTALGVGHKIAMTIAYVIGVMISFLLNRSWSFGHSGSAQRALVRYVGAYVVGYLINLAILLIGVDRLGFPHQAVQAIAIVLVAACLFLMHKFWVFAPDIPSNAT